MKENNIIADLSLDFAIKIIQLYKVLVENREYILSKQLLRAACSIGANVEEASAGYTKREFTHKMSIASREARETRYWLKLLSRSKLVNLDYSGYLAEIEVIIRILTRIVKTSQDNP